MEPLPGPTSSDDVSSAIEPDGVAILTEPYQGAQRSRIFRNGALNLIGQGVVLLVNLFASRFLFTHLGSDAFGIVMFSLLLNTVVVSALELGVSTTVVREVAASYDTDRSYAVSVIRFAGLVYWMAAVVIAGSIFLLAPVLVGRWIHLGTMSVNEASTVLRIIAIGAAFTLPRTLYSSLFRGRQRMEFNNIIDPATAITQQAGLALVLWFHADIVGVSFWLAISSCFAAVAYYLAATRMFGWRSLLPGYSAMALRHNRRFALHMFAVTVLSTVHTQSDKLIVSKFMSVSDFGLYAFAAGLPARAGVVTTAISQASFPSLAELFRNNARSRMMQQYRKIEETVNFGTLPMFAAVAFAALPIFARVFNNQVGAMLVAPTVLLCVGWYMNSALSVPYMLSVAMGKPELTVRTNTVGIFVLLPLTVALVYEFGLVGAGLSWIAYHIFAYVYFVRMVCTECLNTSPWRWYLGVAKAFGLGAVAYGGPALVVSAGNPYDPVGSAVGFGVGTVLYLAGSYVLIGPEMRLVIRSIPSRVAFASALHAR